jgi:hypothetical protein
MSSAVVSVPFSPPIPMLTPHTILALHAPECLRVHFAASLDGVSDLRKIPDLPDLGSRAARLSRCALYLGGMYVDVYPGRIR